MIALLFFRDLSQGVHGLPHPTPKHGAEDGRSTIHRVPYHITENGDETRANPEKNATNHPNGAV